MSQTSVSKVRGHPGVPNYTPDHAKMLRLMAGQANRANNGKVNVTIDVTLAASATQTLISDNRIGPTSAVAALMALTPNAATAIAAGIWFDTPKLGVNSTSASILAHHSSNASTSQTIRFGIFG